MTRHGTEAVRLKVQQFIDELTPAERAELRSAPAEFGAGVLSLALEAKARQVADGFTPEERTQLRRLAQDAGSGAATGDQSDVEGYMNPLYDDGEGYKGRPRPTEGTGGGGGFTDPYLSNIKPGSYVQGAKMLLSVAGSFLNPSPPW